MHNIVIFGASGHAKVIVDIIEKAKLYTIIGILDPSYKSASDVLGYPIIGTDSDLASLLKRYNIYGGIVAIGDNFLRASVMNKIINLFPDFRFVTAIHPSAQIGKNVSIGDGSVIMAGAVISPSTEIGRSCIVNTAAVLEHDCIMQDFSSLAPHAVVGGNCRINRYSAIAINATLMHGITIGEHSVIGACALVTKDIDAYTVAYGTPAKPVRSRTANEPYL